MQFYKDGFRGANRTSRQAAQPATGAQRATLPEKVDVLIAAHGQPTFAWPRGWRSSRRSRR